jgi:hypothetical protein
MSENATYMKIAKAVRAFGRGIDTGKLFHTDIPGYHLENVPMQWVVVSPGGDLTYEVGKVPLMSAFAVRLSTAKFGTLAEIVEELREW